MRRRGVIAVLAVGTEKGKPSRAFRGALNASPQSTMKSVAPFGADERWRSAPSATW